ncbi:MAG: chromosomal replication initiator protein DnaA [Armatimonadetes bacterium]|nr:chromosomal replication initiator protein DnaA [Armatimonadota bacterium]
MQNIGLSPEIEQCWQECLKIMENKLEKPTFEIGLKNSKLLSLTQDVLQIGVPSKFARDWLNNRCSDLVNNTFQNLLGKKIYLSFSVYENNTSSKENNFMLNNYNNNFSGEILSFLNPKYTFDSFIVGNSNHFACAASLAVASAPAKTYNPLFIYGGVGLGKTHLMHAIGHLALNKYPLYKIAYVSTEKFTNELITAISERQTLQFRNKYRRVDLLLVDDIQFLIKKESTQEEFFHTFNELHGANKQIVITSDRSPKEIPALEERLRSRFEWGLIADIQTPDLETREAILRKKAEIEKVDVPNDVISFIAEKIPSNIRELEGALIRIIAFASLHKKEITLTLAFESLKEILPKEESNFINLDSIKNKVAEYFGIKMEELIGEKREQRFVFPRQVAMFLARELSGASYPEIARNFGGKDHSTVIHAYKKIRENLKNSQIKSTVEKIKNILGVC